MPRSWLSVRAKPLSRPRLRASRSTDDVARSVGCSRPHSHALSRYTLRPLPSAAANRASRTPSDGEAACRVRRRRCCAAQPVAAPRPPYCGRGCRLLPSRRGRGRRGWDRAEDRRRKAAEEGEDLELIQGAWRRHVQCPTAETRANGRSQRSPGSLAVASDFGFCELPSCVEWHASIISPKAFQSRVGEV
jgi:hypothetical protein